MAHKAARDPKEHTENMAALTEALSPIRERLDVHGEMLNRILLILTEEKQSDGPTIYDLLADLIKRIDNQSRYLADLTTAVAQLGINLPLDLVKAIDDNLDIPHRTNGHANGADPA